MPYPAAAIANEFLELAKGEAKPITPMHIQKYVYFGHGWYLAFRNDPFIQERIYAWPYGPVIPELYDAFKQYGSSQILSPAKVYVPHGTGIDLTFELCAPWIDDEKDKPAENEYAHALVRRVWDVYKGFSAMQLSRLTHAEGSPWSLAKAAGLKVINDDVIARYFKSLVKENG